jgi:hypothetical protein
VPDAFAAAVADFMEHGGVVAKTLQAAAARAWALPPLKPMPLGEPQ